MACDHSQPCGCNQDELTTLPDPCDTTNCVGEPCDQIIDCNCVRYNGAAIPQLDIAPGDSLCDIITDLIGLGGVPGASAYDVAVAEGFVGTETAWLLSLKGIPGNPGAPGAPGANGNPGAKGNNGDNGNNGDYIETVVEPKGVNCISGGIRVNTLSGINGSIINTEYICNPPVYKMMMAQAYGPDLTDLSDIPTIPPVATVGADGSQSALNSWSVFQSGQNIVLGPNKRIDEWGNSYNTTTGVWTCPEDGYYDLSYYIHLTLGAPDDFDEGWGDGVMIAAIMNSAHSSQFGGSEVVTRVNTCHVDIQGSRLMVPIATGNTLVLRILNKTTKTYVAHVGDVIRFTIRKVRDLNPVNTLS